VISICIIGGSGYTGKHLIQLCGSHPFVNSISVYGFKTAGMHIKYVFPELAMQFPNLIVEDSNKLSYEHDVYFIALPHGEALKYVPELISKGKLVIDIGGDYRLDNADKYTKWYKIQHTSPELLSNKLYGLADYLSSDLYTKNLIANPGCYPTSALLSLLPLVENFAGDIDFVSTSAYSGTSGAGKSANHDLSLSEMFGNVRAYNVNSHRHQPEIEQMMDKYGFKSAYSLTTHLLPVAVGIYATTTVHMKKEVSQDTINNLYVNKYKHSPFVRMREVPPNLSWVVNTNFCDINISAKGKIIIITAAIDNLIKGAAGQAVQNLNKFYKWDETLGIISKGAANV
jgi:N-acetyl-gamma-glutamyl-phosphate reductase